MADLRDREIFAVGTWNGITFSEDDLDDIVANFDKLAEKHNVPLKLGHNDEQKITDGQPALGWVTRVYREGKKLLADFTDVPRVIVDAIKKKLYRSVSVEVLFNVDNDGNKFNHVLDAVAILGADHPAVNNLADLDTLLAARAEFIGGHRVAFTVSEGNVSDEGDIDMPISEKDFEKLQASVTSLSEKIDEKDGIIDELRAKNDKLEKDAADREKAERAGKIAATREEIKGLLDGAVTEGKITPAQREIYEEMFSLNDDAKILDVDIKQLKMLCSVSEPRDDGKGAKSVNGDKPDFDNPGDEILKLTKKFQVDHGENSFTKAMMSVCEANPELHKAYLDSNGEV